MNSHNPFNTGGSGGCTNDFRSADQLVDRIIGDAYHVVKEVYLALGNLTYIYNYLQKYGLIITVDSEDAIKDIPLSIGKFARVYNKSDTAGYYFTDYLYVEDDRTGIIPNDSTATGSWVSTKATGSNTSFVRIWKYVGEYEGQTTIQLPDDIPIIDVQTIYVSGVRQDSGDGFVYNEGNKTITLADELEIGTPVTAVLGVTDPDLGLDIFSILAKSDAASTIGAVSETNEPSTVADELVAARNKLKAFEDALAKPDGYKLVGSVASFSSMRLMTGLVQGQRVKLASYYSGGNTGGGEFIVKAGSAVDDAGHICVPASQSGIYLERRTSTVKLSDYGITTESNSSGPRVDQSDKLQAAINRAKSLKYVLDTEIASENHYIYTGIYVEKGIDITGLKTIRGCFSLLFDSTKIAGLSAPGYSDVQWALVNLNAKFDTAGIIFGTTVGNQSFDSIVVRDVSTRGASCGGQLHVTSGTMVSGALCATDVNGPGVWVLGSYDSVISDIRTVNCGNALLWAIDIAGYRGTRVDNTNCMVINRIESHDSLDRALRCSADLSDIGEIHIEATVVASNAVSSSATIADNGWGYANVLLAGLGTTYGSVRDLPVSGSIPAIFELVADDTSIGELSLPRSSLSIHYAFTTPRGTLSAGTINLSGDVIVTGGSNTNIDALTVTGASSKITSSSTNFNVGILRATGANATFTGIGGRYGRLDCAVVFLTGSDVTRGSITNLTLGDRNTLTQVTAQTLLVNGTRNYLSDGFRVSGVSTLNGINNAASNVVFVGIVTLTDPWKFDKVYMNSNLVYTGNTTSTLYDVSFQDVFVAGDLVLSGACRIHGHNLRVINLRIGTMSTGFIVLNNCVVAGGVEGNYVGSFNVPAIGSITQNFTTGVPYVYTPTGWKLLTAAA